VECSVIWTSALIAVCSYSISACGSRWKGDNGIRGDGIFGMVWSLVGDLSELLVV
jgi:hypothetical protein